MPLKLVLGTRNRKKREEIVEILSDLGLEFGDLNDFPDAPEVDEDGTTFEANARKKATELARALGHWVLGEDSGLVVPGLGGRPGVWSARYAGRQGDDAANNAKLTTSAPPPWPTRRARSGPSPRAAVTASSSRRPGVAAASATTRCF
jgi:non-canonical purine NTP pyrophosphatase (RdgB/HAM1 family)